MLTTNTARLPCYSVFNSMNSICSCLIAGKSTEEETPFDEDVILWLITAHCWASALVLDTETTLQITAHFYTTHLLNRWTNDPPERKTNSDARKSKRSHFRRQLLRAEARSFGAAHIHRDSDSRHREPSKPSKAMRLKLMKKYDWFKTDSLMAAIVSS